MRGRNKIEIARKALRKKYDWWKDKDFVKELDRRTAEFESSKAKPITLDELKEELRMLTQTGIKK